jgi:hypothetical protein
MGLRSRVQTAELLAGAVTMPACTRPHSAVSSHPIASVSWGQGAQQAYVLRTSSTTITAIHP